MEWEWEWEKRMFQVEEMACVKMWGGEGAQLIEELRSVVRMRRDKRLEESSGCKDNGSVNPSQSLHILLRAVRRYGRFQIWQ